MKTILAAAAALAAFVAAPASAAPVAAPVAAAAAAPQERVVVRERTVVRRDYRPRAGNRWRYRNVCRTTYRYGERRRVCRRVRYSRY